VRDPMTFPPDMAVRDVISLQRETGFSGFPW
jgi:hypothetical protein